MSNELKYDFWLEGETHPLESLTWDTALVELREICHDNYADVEGCIIYPELRECSQDDGEWIENRVERIEVEIEPNYEELIRRAVPFPDADFCGYDPDDHIWTREGEGGCSQNPGVWSTGGTSFTYSSHCRKCGLRCEEVSLGSQRNPGECDVVEYELASDEQIAQWRKSGAMD